MEDLLRQKKTQFKKTPGQRRQIVEEYLRSFPYSSSILKNASCLCNFFSLILWLFFVFFFTGERKICSITCDFFVLGFWLDLRKVMTQTNYFLKFSDSFPDPSVNHFSIFFILSGFIEDSFVKCKQIVAMLGRLLKK